jgi:hypothetical protein
MSTDSSDSKKKAPPKVEATIQQGSITTDLKGNVIREDAGPPESVTPRDITEEEFNRDDPDFAAPEAAGVTYRGGGRVKSWQRALRQNRQNRRTAGTAAPVAAKPRPSW